LRAGLFLFLLFFSFSVGAKEKIQIIFYEFKAIEGFDANKAKVIEKIIFGDLFKYQHWWFCVGILIFGIGASFLLGSNQVNNISDKLEKEREFVVFEIGLGLSS